MNSRILQLLSAQINSAVAEDAAMLSELNKFEGAEVLIELLGLGVGFIVSIADSKITLTTSKPGIDYKVAISASVLDFMYLMKNKSKPGFVLPKKVKIAGDGVEAMRILNFLGRFNLDWERYLASYIGDVPSHMATKIISSGIGLLSGICKNTQYNIADFITDEMGMVPVKAEVDSFCKEVTVVSDDVSRLEARLNLLLNNHKENK